MAIAINFDLRDESGLLVKFHSTKQREAFLLRNPQMAGKLLPVIDPNAMPAWELPTHVGGRPPAFARQGGLLRDPAPTRKAPTKPTVNTLSHHRRNLHEGSHSVICYLLNRPLVRVRVLESNGNAGHVQHYHQGAPNKDDLIILAAGRAGEEVLLHSVFEHGCSGDDEKARELALKLANGDADAANTLLREAAIAARALVEKYSSAIHKFSMRLAIKKELVLDEADNAVRECIEAFEKKPVELDAEWQQKIARAQASASVREYQKQQAEKAAPKHARVIREFDFSKPVDIRAWNKQMGNENTDAEPIGFGVGHIVQGSYR